MNKVRIQDVSLEIVGNVIKLNYPSKYSLEVNSNQSNHQYTYDRSTSSLSNQINQVEKDQKGFADK